MSAVLEQLVQLLALERLEENLFRGQSQDIGSGRVYGGQVLGQALSAAVQTVPSERVVHSLHAYFLRPGDVKRPIVYDVDRSRDGSSFTTRRVVAIQNGQPIFNLAASFQAIESGFEHQDKMPQVEQPENIPTEHERMTKLASRLPKPLRDRALAEKPFEMRLLDIDSDSFLPEPGPPNRMIWFKAVAPLPDDLALHQYLLAYASDYAFVTTSLRPHGVTWLTPGMQVASLDHAMWFHRPFRVDSWLLYVIESPSAQASRGLVRGQIYSQDGQLVASTAQEGLIRQRGTD